MQGMTLEEIKAVIVDAAPQSNATTPGACHSICRRALTKHVCGAGRTSSLKWKHGALLLVSWPAVKHAIVRSGQASCAAVPPNLQA